MKIIRDEVMTGILMIPLFQQYGIKRCNVKDCKEKPSTIVTECVDSAGYRLDFALCEVHYQECKQSGKIDYSLEFANDKITI
jgi:hypothetical protein